MSASDKSNVFPCKLALTSCSFSKISADKSGAEFSLLTDLGRKATPRYEGLGQTFKTYIIGPDGKVKKILTGTKLVRPNAKSVVEALKNTGQ